MWLQLIRSSLDGGIGDTHEALIHFVGDNGDGQVQDILTFLVYFTASIPGSLRLCLSSTRQVLIRNVNCARERQLDSLPCQRATFFCLTAPETS